MIQVSCIGTSIDEATEEQLQTYCAIAHDYGRTHQISGCFIYRDTGWLMIIEGEPAKVDEAFWALCTSHRIARMRLLARNHLVKRNFPDWVVSFSYASSVTTRMPSFRKITDLEQLEGDSRMVEQRIRAFRDGNLRCD